MSPEQRSKSPVAIVLKGYPRLSETFIAQEIRSLEKAGFDIRLYSMRQPTDKLRHPVHDEIEAPVTYLPEYLHHEPGRVFRAWWRLRKSPGYAKAHALFQADFERDKTRNRVRRFGQALVLAYELPTDVRWLHAHFIHTPASVVRYASVLTGLPFTVSAHAKDIWTSPDWELTDKLDEADWTVTCTKLGAKHLATLTQHPTQVHLSYHGLDFDRLPTDEISRPARDGASADDPVRLLSVGRGVPKKGFDLAIEALAQLDPALNWRFEHIGGGGEIQALKDRADALGIADRITWLGAQAQTRVLQAYHESDLFILPCRIGEDGDRDGLPNVIVEAQSQGLPVISTSVSSITELLEDGVNGPGLPT